MELLVIWLWIGSAICAAIAVGKRASAIGGFMLGLVFGPVGVLAALGVDERAQCPRCGGRLAKGEFPICPHCGGAIAWEGTPDVRKPTTAPVSEEEEERQRAARQAACVAHRRKVLGKD